MITADLVPRVERELARDAATLVGAMRGLDPTSVASVVTRAGGVVAFTGPGLPVNRAIGLGVADEAGPADLDFVVEFFDKRRMPAEIELCPYADDRLRARASERGFSVAWFREVFVRPIGSRIPAPNLRTDFDRVEGESTLVQWAAMHRALRPTPSDEAFDQMLAARHAVPGANDFVVRRDGVTLGVCSMTVHDGVALLGNAGVLPDYRGAGIHADSVAFRLRVASALGCELAIAPATPRSPAARNLERAGFMPRYTSACLRRPR